MIPARIDRIKIENGWSGIKSAIDFFIRKNLDMSNGRSSLKGTLYSELDPLFQDEIFYPFRDRYGNLDDNLDDVTSFEESSDDMQHGAKRIKYTHESRELIDDCPVVIEGKQHSVLKGYYFDLNLPSLDGRIFLAHDGICNNGIPDDSTIIWVKTSEDTTCSIRGNRGWVEYEEPSGMQIRIDSIGKATETELFITLVKKQNNQLNILKIKIVPLELITKIKKRTLTIRI